MSTITSQHELLYSNSSFKRIPGFIWGAILGVFIFLNIKFDGASSLYLSHLILIIVMLVAALHRGYQRFFYYAFIAAFINIILLVWGLSVVGPDAIRFLPEYLKLALLVFGAFLVSYQLKEEYLAVVIKWLPYLLALQVLLVWILGGWNTYSPNEFRYSLPLMGSPNTTAFIIAVCLVILHSGAVRLYFRTNSIVYYGSYMILLVTLVATQSMGGVLTYLAGINALYFSRSRTYFVSFVFVVIFMFGLMWFLYSKNELLASGRLLIWKELIFGLVRDNKFLFGQGVGSINLMLYFKHDAIQSAHSMYVSIFHGYGILGLAIFCSIILSVRPKPMQAAHGRKFILSSALWYALVVSMFFDSYLLSAQLVWAVPFILALILMNKKFNGIKEIDGPHGNYQHSLKN